MTHLEQLRREYNTAVSNGLFMEARRIRRIMNSLERKIK